MEALLKFLKQQHLAIIIKGFEYMLLSGYIIDVDPYTVTIEEYSDHTVHYLSINSIVAIGLDNREITPGPCLFSKLPLIFPPFCWSCTSTPNALVLELILLQKTAPPDTVVHIDLDAFESIRFTLQNIYAINEYFIFVCMPAPTNPDIFVPIALSNQKLKSFATLPPDTSNLTSVFSPLI